MPEALAEWNALDGSVRTPLKKLLAKRLDNPHVPGDELHGVLAVDKREDGVVYGSATARRPKAAPATPAHAPRTSRRKPGA